MNDWFILVVLLYLCLPYPLPSCPNYLHYYLVISLFLSHPLPLTFLIILITFHSCPDSYRTPPPSVHPWFLPPPPRPIPPRLPPPPPASPSCLKPCSESQSDFLARAWGHPVADSHYLILFKMWRKGEGGERRDKSGGKGRDEVWKAETFKRTGKEEKGRKKKGEKSSDDLTTRHCTSKHICNDVEEDGFVSCALFPGPRVNILPVLGLYRSFYIGNSTLATGGSLWMEMERILPGSLGLQ
jgi:hypothetical protein